VELYLKGIDTSSVFTDLNFVFFYVEFYLKGIDTELHCSFVVSSFTSGALPERN